MTALPRAICPVCHRSVAVRTNGDVREHLNAAPSHAGRKCKGSGKPVKR